MDSMDCLVMWLSLSAGTCSHFARKERRDSGRWTDNCWDEVKRKADKGRIAAGLSVSLHAMPPLSVHSTSVSVQSCMLMHAQCFYVQHLSAQYFCVRFSACMHAKCLYLITNSCTWICNICMHANASVNSTWGHSTSVHNAQLACIRKTSAYHTRLRSTYVCNAQLACVHNAAVYSTSECNISISKQCSACTLSQCFCAQHCCMRYFWSLYFWLQYCMHSQHFHVSKSVHNIADFVQYFTS